MKGSIRDRILSTRNTLSINDVLSLSTAIRHNLLSLPEVLQAENIFLYVSFQNEVDTIALIDHWQHNKILFIPYIADKHKHLMYPSRLHSLDHLDMSEFGIQSTKEPMEAPVSQMDIVIVPGVAFDKKGHRIGFGKGFYDRSLQDYKGLKIALGYSFQVVDNIPSHDHDVIMDYVITEREVIKCK